jgi:thioredoxin 1
VLLGGQSVKLIPADHQKEEKSDAAAARAFWLPMLLPALPGECCARLLFSADVSGAEGARPMSAVQEITDANFETEVINSDLPVLIDFWAPWCGPCRAIGPVVDELSREFTGKLKVVKMNVDDNPLTPSRFGVRSIPNLLLFKNGQVKDQIVGAVPKQTFLTAINKIV